MCDGCLNLVDAVLGRVHGRRRRNQLFMELFPRTHGLISETETPTEHPVAYAVRVRMYPGGPGPLRGVIK